MEHITENAPVLFPQKPEPAPPETVEMKRSYSRAGLSVTALYGAIAKSEVLALAVILMLVFVFYAFGAFSPVDTEEILHFGAGSYTDILSHSVGDGVIATLLAVFLLIQAGAWIVGFVMMRLVLPKGTPIEKRNLSFGRFLVIALMCFGVWGVGAVLGNLSSFFGVETMEMFSTETLGWEMLPYLIYAVIGAPIVEELTFRKALCDRLHDTHEGYAAVVSGLLFGLMHGNHHQFFLAFFIGMLFAMVYQRTGRVIYTMLLHCMVNFTATLPEFCTLAGFDITIVWNIVVGTLIVAGLIVLLIKRKDPLLHVAPCTVPGANSAVYRNLGMRLVRIAALILIGGQGMLLMLTGMLSEDVDKWAFYLIDAIPLTLVFLTVFLLPVFTKRYERDFSHLGPMDCAEEMGV